MTPDAFNAYITWVVYAAVGQTAQSDVLLHDPKRRPLILEGAAAQRAAHPVKLKGTLYRGVLLEPSRIIRGMILPDARLQSISYSENLDVAQYFADKNSSVSFLVRTARPNVRGYILTRERVLDEDVLFHHSWHRTGIVMPKGMPAPWDRITSMPLGPVAGALMGDDLALQLMWALRTQEEVILLQDNKSRPVRPRSDYPSPTTSQLNERFHPPYLQVPA